ncbi:MAG: 5'/3'-nucleotidase SurE [Bacteroidetes bacterium]|nr:MAG: 5'/3'-nucleotidase SurE [Bacteroidota bacterium]
MKETIKQKPLILITNDDGVEAPGLRKLINIARELGDVAVVAPDKPQSGMSHAITMSHPLRLKKIAEEEGYQEYSCNGTPVDSVKLGEQIILGRYPDLVLSGINHGSNASVNVIYSGTMAAVIEATIDGISAIGFSLLDYSHQADFNHVDDHITQIIKNVLQKKLPKGVCLNVNIPAASKHKIKGVKICRQAKGRWAEKFDIRTDPYKKEYYWLTGVFEDGDTSPDTDSWALANNYVTVVPVHYDLTAHQAIEELKEWEKD